MTPVFTGYSRKYAEGARPSAYFLVLNAERILIDIQAPKDETRGLWSAGWVNASIVDASAPVFSVLVGWQRIPLGASYFKMPEVGLIRVVITLHNHVPSSYVKVWA